MLLKQFVIISSTLIVGILTKALPITTYDQRQNGKYNIHFNIKDVQIISLDGDNLPGIGDDTVYDYGDYDYDPDHLTINPIFGTLSSKPTTKKPAAPVFVPAPSTVPSTVSTTTASPSTTATPTTTTPTSSTTTTTEKIATTTTLAPTIETTTIKNKTHSVEVLLDEVAIGHGPSVSYMERPSSINNSHSPKPQHSQPQQLNIDYEEIPVEVIVEPVLRPKYRHNRKPLSGKYVRKPSIEIIRGDDERTALKQEENLSNQRVHQRNVEQVKCGRGEFRDQQGRCRYRRSGTGFRNQLINFLTALKKNNN